MVVHFGFIGDVAEVMFCFLPFSFFFFLDRFYTYSYSHLNLPVPLIVSSFPSSSPTPEYSPLQASLVVYWFWSYCPTKERCRCGFVEFHVRKSPLRGYLNS